MGQITDIMLDQIVDDRALQVRTHRLNRDHIESLLSSGPARWPPLLVFPLGEGSFALVDGNHRLAAARELGLHAVPCEVVDGDVYALAVEANIQHGLPLDREARKSFARYLYQHYPDMPWRELGRRSGLHHETAKAAVASSGENRQQADDKRFDPVIETRSALVGLFKHLERATFAASEPDNFVSLFSSPDAQEWLTDSIRTVVEQYPNERRRELALAFVLVGLALSNGARDYVTW